MTAEIAIINRQGIALAADSAVTVGRTRVWKTANKLFSLGPANDVAIMIYNSGDFVGIPWEVVVKDFRESIGTKAFATVLDCEKAFFSYLDKTKLPPSSDSDFTVFSILLDFIDDLALRKTFKRRLDVERHLDEVAQAITGQYPDDELKLRNVIPYDVFSKKFRSDISILCKDAFGFNLTKIYVDKVQRMTYELLSRKVESSFMSGVVFAGYGTQQLMPFLSHYVVDGRMRYQIKKEERRQTRFWLKRRYDLGQKDTGGAFIIPFAQFDMFYLFMEGITQSHMEYIETVLRGILQNKANSLIENFVAEKDKVTEMQLQIAENDEIGRNFFEEFAAFRSKTLVDPVLSVVRALPKEEMAAMAQALVELTALRRKVDSNLESVGGPTDVAVISKGEGMVWMKRKHYFDSGLNDDFAVRKRLRLLGGGDV